MATRIPVIRSQFFILVSLVIIFVLPCRTGGFDLHQAGLEVRSWRLATKEGAPHRSPIMPVPVSSTLAKSIKFSI
jgi:hypothetical protein